MAHAAESLHWYSRNGETAYEVKGANGNMRPTTLRDARKLNLVPSVTSIIKCAAAPGLERWKLDQMLHAALTLPRDPQEAEDKWIERVWADSKETARKAAERGTAIHAAIQGAFEGEPPHEDMQPYVKAAKNALAEFAGPVLWTSERSFAHRLGFGGKVDISASKFIVDFKTKEFGADDDLKTWDEHAMQLAAYRHGLGMESARCAIVYVSTTNPGLARLMEIEEKELKRGWEMFRSLLSYWKAKSNYEAGWMEQAA